MSERWVLKKKECSGCWLKVHGKMCAAYLKYVYTRADNANTYQLVEADRCVRDQPPLSTQLHIYPVPRFADPPPPLTFRSLLSTLVFFFPRAIIYA